MIFKKIKKNSEDRSYGFSVLLFDAVDGNFLGGKFSDWEINWLILIRRYD